MDILDALSDLPEDYAALGLPKTASPKSSGPARAAQTHEGGITMKHTNESKLSLFQSKLGIAAAIAVCIGLNAALILGIISMNKDAGSMTSGAATAVQTETDTVTSAAASLTETVLTTAAQETSDISVPDLVGKDRETAKRIAKENGLLLSVHYTQWWGLDPETGKYLRDPETGKWIPQYDAPADTVVGQSPGAGESVQKNARVVECDVVMRFNPLYWWIPFRVDLPANHTGQFYIYMRDEQQEILGCSSVFRMDGEEYFCPIAVDCTEPEIKGEAVLVNAETGKEAVMGSYSLHCGRLSGSCNGDYDVISEDFEAAFKAVTE